MFKPFRYKLNANFGKQLGLNCIKTMEVEQIVRKLLETRLLTTHMPITLRSPLSLAESARVPEALPVLWVRVGGGNSHSEVSSQHF